MDNHFVRAAFDLECTWEGIPPVYRIYVNNELFTEREWIWSDNEYLTQILQISAPAGKYDVRVETVGPCLAEFVMSNNRIDQGPARWLKNFRIIINP